MNAPLKPDALIADSVPHVLTAINAVMASLSKEGIAKGRDNAQQGYKFRGIDDVYNALSPVLADHALVITPRCISRHKEVVQSQNGRALFYVTVQMEFELASAKDGSITTASMFGEAMDSADKATNKAMSAAYKYMAMQVFCIPTEGDNDADATTHQLASAEDHAIGVLRAMAVDAHQFKTTWAQNKDSWKKLLQPDAYARVVAVMKELGGLIAEQEKARAAEEPPREATPFDDTIPF